MNFHKVKKTTFNATKLHLVASNAGNDFQVSLGSPQFRILRLAPM